MLSLCHVQHLLSMRSLLCTTARDLPDIADILRVCDLHRTVSRRGDGRKELPDYHCYCLRAIMCISCICTRLQWQALGRFQSR